MPFSACFVVCFVHMHCARAQATFGGMSVALLSPLRDPLAFALNFSK